MGGALCAGQRNAAGTEPGLRSTLSSLADRKTQCGSAGPRTLSQFLEHGRYRTTELVERLPVPVSLEHLPPFVRSCPARLPAGAAGQGGAAVRVCRHRARPQQRRGAPPHGQVGCRGLGQAPQRAGRRSGSPGVQPSACGPRSWQGDAQRNSLLCSCTGTCGRGALRVGHAARGRVVSVARGLAGPACSQVALRDGPDQRGAAHAGPHHVRHRPGARHAAGRARLVQARSRAGA